RDGGRAAPGGGHTPGGERRRVGLVGLGQVEQDRAADLGRVVGVEAGVVDGGRVHVAGGRLEQGEHPAQGPAEHPHRPAAHPVPQRRHGLVQPGPGRGLVHALHQRLGLGRVGGDAAAVQVGGECHQPGRGQLVAGGPDVWQQAAPVVHHQHAGPGPAGRLGQVGPVVLGHGRSAPGSGSTTKGRYRVGMTAFRRPRHVELHAFRGYGTPTRLRVRGRVLRATGLVRSRLGDSVVDNLRNMFHRFESDEVPGALVAARAARGAQVGVRADAEGYFDAVLDLPRPLDDPRVWEPVELELLEPATPTGANHAPGQVLVPRDPQFAVVSDLDDTVLHSHATSLWQMARLTLLHNAHTRLPFEGVAGVYQALQRGRDGEAYNPVFYVSNSPWNLYDLLEDFLALQGIPRGPLLLRDWSLRTLKTGEGHQLAAIKALLDAYPGLQVVLVGDSGERDPEIYPQAVLG